MTHSIRRRMRALAALSTCMLAVMATAGEGPASNVATTGESAIESLRSAVEREASRLRTSLDAAEATRDWTELLERKCTVDAAFAPLHLMLDAMEWQAPGACNDLFRTMRTEWLDAPVTAQWSHADGESRARRALAAWAPPPGGGQALRVEFRTGSEAWVAGDAPPTIQWTADGCWLEGRPSLHARCWWRLPVAEPVRFDFPLSADGFDVWWDQAGARLQDDRGNAHAERWSADAIFNNPPDIYAAFDSLRTAVARDRAVQAAETGAVAGASDGPDTAGAMLAPGGDPDPHSTLRIRTVRTQDGRLLRTERWHWQDAELRSVVIDQEPVRLRHHAEHGVEIVTELEGKEAGRSPHRAESEVVHFPRGARIAIAFRTPDPPRDRVANDVPGATVPDRWVLSVNGSMRAWAEFGSVRVGSADHPDKWFTERVAVLGPQGAEHRAAADRLARAIELRSSQEIHLAEHGIAAALAGAGATSAAVATEWELVASRLLNAGMDAECDALLGARWLPAAGIAGARDAIERSARNGGSPIAEHMARIADLPMQLDVSSAMQTVGSDARPSGDASSNADAARCDAATLPGGAHRVHDAVRSAVLSAVDNARERASLLASLCAGCARASPGLETVDDDRAAALGADARTALALGHWSSPPDGEDGAIAPDFGSSVVSAASRTPMDHGRIAAMRSAWDRCADIAVDALRRSLRESAADAVGGEHAAAAQARRTLRARRALVGNVFAPSLDAADCEMEVDATALLAWIEPAVAAAVRRELRRAEVTASVLGGPLATARAETADRRMAEAAAAAAAGAYLRWSSGEAPRPSARHAE